MMPVLDIQKPSSGVNEIENAPQRPWYQWFGWAIWLIVLVLMLEFAVGSVREREAAAAWLAWLVFGFWLIGGITYWQVQRIDAEEKERTRKRWQELTGAEDERE